VLSAHLCRAGQVNSKAMRGLFDAFDDNGDGCIDERARRSAAQCRLPRQQPLHSAWCRSAGDRALPCDFAVCPVPALLCFTHKMRGEDRSILLLVDSSA